MQAHIRITNLILFAFVLLILAQACINPTEEHVDDIDYDQMMIDMRLDTGIIYREGIISTSDHDEGGLLATNFGETYFWRRKPGEKQKIYMMESPPYQEGRMRKKGDTVRFQSKPSVTSFSTDRDENPFLTKDGLTLYFASERPIPGRPNKGNFDMNIWITHRDSVGGQWAEPRALPPSFNLVQAEGEDWPTANINSVFSLDDQNFYVSTQNPGDTVMRLYVYQRDASDNLIDPKRVYGLFSDSKYSVSGAQVSPDGKYLVFNSYGAPGGEGGEDIYVSRNEGFGRWSQAVPLTTINTEHEEAGPSFGPYGNLHFGRSRLIDSKTWEYDVWNIHVVPVRMLKLESLFPLQYKAARDM